MPSRQKVTRRRFLQGVTAAGAATLSAPLFVRAAVLGREGTVPPSGRVNAGCIGVKNMGGNHFKGLLGNPEARLVAVCDVDATIRAGRLAEAKLAYQGDYTQGYNDYREMLARPDLDCVVIAVPDHSHAYLTVAALKAGKDVYIEKPFSLTIHEGRVMVDTAARYGRILQCGSQRRSSPRVRRCVELVRSGRIGKLERVEVGVGRRPARPEYQTAPEPVPPELDYDRWLGPAPWAPYTKNRCHYNFRFIRDYSGGELTNNGHHAVDLGQWAIGADETGPVEVEGRGVAWADGLYDTFYEIDVWATYAGGVRIHCTHAEYGAKFIGTDGWIDTETYTASPASVLGSVLGAGDVQLPQFKGDHLGNFISAVRTRGAVPTPAPGAVGHRSATVCHLGNIAMTLGRKLRWDAAAERFIGDAEADRLLHRPYRSGWSLEWGKVG